MNKEIIKKYKKEFDWWLEGGTVLLKTTEGVWQKKVNDHWQYEGPYVINDKYVDFRKALAESKTIQVKSYSVYNSFDYTDLTITDATPLESFCVEDLRIKPDEPKFKVGDWARHPISKIIICITELNLMYSTKHLIPWQPKLGDWCWFWCSEYDKPIKQLAKFIRRDYSEPQWTLEVMLQDGDYAKFSYCEPFIGTLPTNIKNI